MSFCSCFPAQRVPRIIVYCILCSARRLNNMATHELMDFMIPATPDKGGQDGVMANATILLANLCYRNLKVIFDRLLL